MAYLKSELNLIMIKKLILLILLAVPLQLLAQTNMLTGNIYDNDTRSINLQGVSIKNLTNKTLSISDKDGHFAINAKIGDLISFGMLGYQTDTVYLTNLFPKNIYLRLEVNNLNTVNINGTKLSPYLDLKNAEAKPAKQVDYSKERGGLRLNLGYGKFRRDQAKLQELSEREKYEDEISKNFNEATIKALLKFEGPTVKDFMSLYRPTVEQVKAERPFKYDYYTAVAYRSWLRLPADQRKLPPLPKLKSN